ncbi:hypothetical protein KAFR_0A02180 [Kazachstania africana CBS 2517]|uniref:TrmE-type G domain-containing protein n=1 Tax=Kazachstania africana (strain ATCC 22294 / BCRC 22015 / CBS 2517 / CECT 1963 / NBRC 1671 / NRRL Y-8276) TaxID=1071382 RepID=H2AMQ6_KAZAF|nr:hypothetical protein KAFR_0A02180 [Kazachstania africana CBS 2517]CCF55656.1 hypothetical protein KAFR_0A02180 [Kazachstania africana CBS 2517]
MMLPITFPLSTGKMRLYSRLVKPLTSNFPTIYALSTPTGHKSAISVIRISGSHAKYIYHKLTRCSADPIPREAVLRKLYHPFEIINNKPLLLDSSLILFFQSPKSFTGEDILELHVHGGRAIVSSVLNAINLLHDRSSNFNIRYAQPGEFSKRAFHNSKFDLTEVEAINDLINADTEAQRRSILSSLNGDNKLLFREWRSLLITCMAQLTAIIDFGDDNDLSTSHDIIKGVSNKILGLKNKVIDFINKVERADILNDGIKIVFMGSPNVGKSSLLNMVTNDDTSIVSDIPGTTRDSVSTLINIGGQKIIMTDTAGIRKESNDKIELLGIERAKEKSGKSDICILVLDPTRNVILDAEVISWVKSLYGRKKEILVVLNKSDLFEDKKILESIKRDVCSSFKGLDFPIITTSSKTSSGVKAFFTVLKEKTEKISFLNKHSEAITISMRAKEILRKDVLYGINEFLKSNNDRHDLIILSENLQYSIDGISKITGEHVDVEEILDAVFSKFCIGK